MNTAFTVKNLAQSRYPTGLKKIYLDLASARFRVHSVFKNVHSGEWIQKVADSLAGFTRYVWGKNVVDSKISGYVWTEL